MGKVLFALYAAASDAADKETLPQGAACCGRSSTPGRGAARRGSWHEKIYPHQMWPDGACMAGPFLAKYAGGVRGAGGLDDAVKEILLAEIAPAR